MTVKEIAKELNLKFYTCEDVACRKEAHGCYIGDLLSFAMSKVEADNVWITIQTNPDREIRKGNSLTWAIPADLISDHPFQVGELTIDPAVDMLCMGGDENSPTLEWGVWPVKKDIFADTYELL